MIAPPISPTFSRVNNRFLCFCLFLLGLFAALRPCPAEDNAPLENRFLFIIETSSNMSRSADAVQGAVASILGSEMQGQLRPGDTVGFWTYSDKLSTDFPMQIWSESQKKNLLDAVSAHLHAVRYAKKGHLDQVWPSVLSVMKVSRTLTIIFIFDGTEPIKGTRFDSEINDLHKEYQRELRSANLPFVTVLAARNGEVFDYSVNSPSSPIRIPQTAEPIKKVEAAPVKAVTNAPAAKPREIRHVIIASPTPIPSPNLAPAAPTPFAPVTNAPAVQPAPALPADPPPPAPAPAQVFVPANGPAAVAQTPVQPVPPPPAVVKEVPKPIVAAPEKTANTAPVLSVAVPPSLRPLRQRTQWPGRLAADCSPWPPEWLVTCCATCGRKIDPASFRSQ